MARQMEDKGILRFVRFGDTSVSALAWIAMDQLQEGHLVDALATSRMIHDPFSRSWVLQEIASRRASLPRLFPPNPESAGSPEIRFAVTASRPLPPDPTSAKETAEDVRRILAEALAAAGGDAPHLVDNMMRIARIQSDAGLRRDSEETIAALLERVRQTKDSRQRALALCKIVEPQGPGCGVPLVIPAGDGAAPPKPQPVARASLQRNRLPASTPQTPAPDSSGSDFGRPED